MRKSKDVKNIFDVFALALPSKEQTAGKLIADSIGQYRFMYYTYMDNFKQKPETLDRLVDGLIYMSITSKIKALYREK